MGRVEGESNRDKQVQCGEGGALIGTQDNKVQRRDEEEQRVRVCVHLVGAKQEHEGVDSKAS